MNIAVFVLPVTVALSLWVGYIVGIDRTNAAWQDNWSRLTSVGALCKGDRLK